MVLTLNQYSMQEIDEFVWITAGIHVTDWQVEAGKQRCTMQGTPIEYHQEPRRILFEGAGARERLERFTDYFEERDEAPRPNS